MKYLFLLRLRFFFFRSRWIWISWEDGFIQVGDGVVVGMYPYVTWMADVIHPVHGVAIASAVDADWEFTDIPRMSSLSDVINIGKMP